MISIPINDRVVCSLQKLKTNDEMSSFFLKKIKTNGENIILANITLHELRYLSAIFNELIIGYNDQHIH